VEDGGGGCRVAAGWRQVSAGADAGCMSVTEESSWRAAMLQEVAGVQLLNKEIQLSIHNVTRRFESIGARWWKSWPKMEWKHPRRGDVFFFVALFPVASSNLIGFFLQTYDAGSSQDHFLLVAFKLGVRRHVLRS